MSRRMAGLEDETLRLLNRANIIREEAIDRLAFGAPDRADPFDGRLPPIDAGISWVWIKLEEFVVIAAGIECFGNQDSLSTAS